MMENHGTRPCSRKHWDIWIALLVVSAIFMVSGCAPQLHIQKAEIRPLPYLTAGWPDIKRVDGLRQALARPESAPVRVLVVHGMIANEPGYSKNLQQCLASRLGLVLGTNSEPLTIYRGYDFTVFSGPQPYDGAIQLKPSEIRKTTWVDPNSRKADRLIFYEMLWAPLRDEVKNRFLACFESRSADSHVDCIPPPAAQRNSDSRTWINGALKDHLLVGGFADATIMLSPVGDVLRDDVTLAMCMIATDVLNTGGFSLKQPSNSRCDLAAVARDSQARQAAGLALEKTEFFAMTHSLGSFLVMDAQQRFAQARAKLKDDVVRETLAFYLFDNSVVYMRANQVALLQLGRLSAVCTPRTNHSPCPNRVLPTEDGVMNSEQPLAQMTTYVAFNDVNDLLGFELPPYLPDTGLFGTLINISVQNPGFSIPFLFKDPYAAHNNYDDNPAVIEAIVEGVDLPNQKALMD